MSDLNDPRFATTLARGLSVLRAFRVTDDGLSNAEIAQRTGAPLGTVKTRMFAGMRHLHEALHAVRAPSVVAPRVAGA